MPGAVFYLHVSYNQVGNLTLVSNDNSRRRYGKGLRVSSGRRKMKELTVTIVVVYSLCAYYFYRVDAAHHHPFAIVLALAIRTDSVRSQREWVRNGFAFEDESEPLLQCLCT